MSNFPRLEVRSHFGSSRLPSGRRAWAVAVLAQIFAIGGVKKYQIKRRTGAGRQLQQVPWPKGDIDVWIKQSFIFADQFCRFTSVIDQPQTLCAARKGLKPQSTGSGEKVKNLRVLQRISKPPRGKHVELILAHAVGGWAQMCRGIAFANRGQSSSAMCACDYSQDFSRDLRSVWGSLIAAFGGDLPRPSKRLPTI